MPDFDPLAGPGCIVLAAYQPDSERFGRQLRSIADQEIEDWTCVITADGEPDHVEAMVKRLVGPDSRFTVVGSLERVGFYRNFERGLAAAPREATWVALADQDDYWYPAKLSTLLPHLRGAALVSGQAMVRRPNLLPERTHRRDVPVSALLVDNQVTGSFSAFRAELLEVCLPFPEPADGAYHDHWLGLCAKVMGGATFVDEVVQDYVQHGANVIGESEHEPVISRVRRIRLAAQGGAALAVLGERLEWRRRMAGTLLSRTVPDRDQAVALRLWAGTHRFRLAASIITTAARRQSPPLRAASLALAAATTASSATVREDEL
ncbi:glycosyltransferase [Pedococcus bigeumensis]|uniref:glycosyltransferase n=1 Tax=Pedococcus bigeumensis TaxID=433644 RepID=UPI002FEC0F17